MEQIMELLLAKRRAEIKTDIRNSGKERVKSRKAGSQDTGK
jgi:hypothetical protein